MARRIVPFLSYSFRSLNRTNVVSSSSISISGSKLFHSAAGSWAGVMSDLCTATCTVFPTCLKLACHAILSRLALLRAITIAEWALSRDSFKRWLLMNISQLGVTMALNMPMMVTSISISSIVKPSADAVDRLLRTFFIDIYDVLLNGLKKLWRIFFGELILNVELVFV